MNTNRSEHHDHHHENRFPLLEVTTHETAIVGTVKCKIPVKYDEGIKILKKASTDIAKEIEDLGGIIGHIKAFVKEEGRSCMISVTEADDIQLKEGSANVLHVEMANIVFGISKDIMTDILKRYFADYVKNCS